MDKPIVEVPMRDRNRDSSGSAAPGASEWSPEPTRSWAIASDTPGLYLPPGDIEPVIPLPPAPEPVAETAEEGQAAPGTDTSPDLPTVLAGLAALRGPGSLPETFVLPPSPAESVDSAGAASAAEPVSPPEPVSFSEPDPFPEPVSLPEPSGEAFPAPAADTLLSTETALPQLPVEQSAPAAPEVLPVIPILEPEPPLPPAVVVPPVAAAPLAERPPVPQFRPRGSQTPGPQVQRAEMTEDAITAKLRETADPDLVAALIAVVTDGASDLHVVADAAPMLRVDGGLRPVLGADVWDDERTSRALRSILSEEQEKRFDEELELDFAVALSAESRFRVNFAIQRGSVAAAFRLIPTKITPLDELGIPSVVGEFSKLPRGLVLVTGPTGSGKSTTLAALIDLVNRTRNDHIVTVEDPIEYMHYNKKALITQREVGEDTRSFAQALKHVLRQDPDVILIGEMRDLETVSVALTAAETGHLVFATLHTQDAGSTIDRVIDVFPPHQQAQVRTQLAATLQGVVCQTLVKRASGTGRVVATEVMFATPAIANLIREGKTYQVASALQSGAQQGMRTMDQSLAELVNTGTITRGAAIEKAQDVITLERMIKRTDLNHDASIRTAI